MTVPSWPISPYDGVCELDKSSGYCSGQARGGSPVHQKRSRGSAREAGCNPRPYRKSRAFPCWVLILGSGFEAALASRPAPA